MDRILVFCAHSDDELVGMGGTILKYIEEGKEVIKIIFSYGEKSHPHLKEEIISKKRIKEAIRASRMMGINETIFLGLKDTDIKNEIKKYNIKNKLKILIKKYRPKQIFIPSEKDPHKDHKAVNDVVKKVIDDMNYKAVVYAYEVWNLVNEDLPYIYVDITLYFRKKVELIKEFKTQKHFLYLLLLPLTYRSIRYGLANKTRYAEKFYKIR